MSRPIALSLSASLSIDTAGRADDPRADFLKLIDRPRVDATFETKVTRSALEIEETEFFFTSEAGQRVPGILMKSSQFCGRCPVVIVLHGTGGTKHSVSDWLRELAEKGFVGVAIDGRYHGGRCAAGKDKAGYQDAIVRAWRERQEHPFFYDTVWDVMRLVDCLETRGEVDSKRIGLAGVSKGGIETYLTAAVDPRIAAAAPCIAVQSFQWALEHDAWQSRIGTIPEAFQTISAEAGAGEPDAAFVQKFYDRVVPGIYGEFDGPAMLPLIAPRPLLVVNGDSDPRTPLPGLHECLDAARAAYREAGAEDQFSARILENTGHEVTDKSRAMVIEWFVRKLEAGEVLWQ